MIGFGSRVSLIWQTFNRLNTDMQGNGGDVFTASSKVIIFKQKVEKWKSQAEVADFIAFPKLNEYIFEVLQLGTKAPDLENEMVEVVANHLQLLLENVNHYF